VRRLVPVLTGRPDIETASDLRRTEVPPPLPPPRGANWCSTSTAWPASTAAVWRRCSNGLRHDSPGGGSSGRRRHLRPGRRQTVPAPLARRWIIMTAARGTAAGGWTPVRW